MPTSSFEKQFAVPKESAEEFVEEMSKPAAATLSRDFQSKLVRDKDEIEKVRKMLQRS